MNEVRFLTSRLITKAGICVVPVFVNGETTHCLASQGIEIQSFTAPLHGYGKLYLAISDTFTSGGIWVMCGNAFAVLRVELEREVLPVILENGVLTLDPLRWEGWSCYHVDENQNKKLLQPCVALNTVNMQGYLLLTNGFSSHRIELNTATQEEKHPTITCKLRYERSAGVCLTVSVIDVTNPFPLEINGDFQRQTLLLEDSEIALMNHQPFAVERSFTYTVNGVQHIEWIHKPERLPTHLLAAGDDKWRFNVPCPVETLLLCGDRTHRVAANTSMLPLSLSGVVSLRSVASGASLFSQELKSKTSLPDLSFKKGVFVLGRVSKENVSIWFKNRSQPLVIPAGQITVTPRLSVNKDIECFDIERVDNAIFLQQCICLFR